MRVVHVRGISRTFLAAAATVALTGGAHANTITVQAFNSTAFGNLVTSNTVVEDFETPGDLALTFEGGGSGNGTAPNSFGEIKAGTSIGSSVGTFTTVGGQGNGSTCQALSVTDNVCDNVGLQFDPDVNGQGNIVPDNGQWSVNAADTKGIEWEAELADGREFSSLFFAIRDAADQGGTIFTVAAHGATKTFSNLDNNDEQLFLVDFGGAVSSATVTMTSSRVNDSFTLDGAAITPVPLPAAGWLMLAGVGGLAAMRRRRKAA
jgi:hypothetical protein